MDTKKYATFLESLDDKDKQYVEKIVANLQYFTTAETLEMVSRSLEKFTKEHSLYNLYLPKGKIGSEHYFILQLSDKLHPVEIICDNRAPSNDYPIIILDDGVFSSHHQCGTIEDFRIDSKCQNKIYILTAVLSTMNVDVMEPYFNAVIIADKIFEELLPNKLFDDYSYLYFLHHFGCETEKVVPVYFEHKIPNEFGAYQFIKKFSKPISRKVIDNITHDDINNFITTHTK